MEKPGMDRRPSCLWSRLLKYSLVLLWLVYPAYMNAQTGAGDEEIGEAEPLLVEIQTSPENPQLNEPWILTFLVDHPAPAEVTVRPPPLPRWLTLESVRTGARIVKTKRWTAVEFWFVPQRPGTVTLKSFDITTPDKNRIIGAISADIQGTLKEYRPYFSWGDLPGSLRIGNPAGLTLRLVNWDPSKPLPGYELLRQEPPEYAIIEEQPLTNSDPEQGVVLRLIVIPLKGQRFELKARTFLHEGITLEIPDLQIPLERNIKEESPREESREAERDPPPPLAIAFPEKNDPVFPLFRGGYEKTTRRAEELWNSRRIAEALAELRRYEQEGLAGFQIARLRRDAERRLGFEVTQDEPWRPRAFYILLGTGSLIFLILLSLRLFHNRQRCLSIEKNVTSSRYRGYTLWAAVCVVAIFSFKKGMLDVVRPQESGGPAVLKSAAAYRVPDEEGGASVYFNEGQRVTIRSVSPSWAYVESFDGRLGWVMRDKLVVY